MHTLPLSTIFPEWLYILISIFFHLFYEIKMIFCVAMFSKQQFYVFLYQSPTLFFVILNSREY